MNGHILSAESSQNHLVQHNKQYHRKVLLSSFHLNGRTLGFHPQTLSFHFDGQTSEFHAKTQTLKGLKRSKTNLKTS